LNAWFSEYEAGMLITQPRYQYQNTLLGEKLASATLHSTQTPQ
jgi:hypothetical protein